MKKVLVLCVCLIGFLSADWTMVIGSSAAPSPPEKHVIKSDSSGVFIKSAVFGFIEQNTTVDYKNFKRITIPEELIDWDTTNAGKPQIPFIRLLIAVPDSCEFNITVYESDYTLFEDYLIYPVPRIVFEETNGCFCSKEVYTHDATFYQKDTLYPGKFYEVNSAGHWRDQRVLEVFLYPVQFNPQQKLMYFYTGLDLRIEYSGEVVENENGLGPFEDIGRDILLNYPGIDWEPESVPEPAVHYYTKLDTNNVADYIIVTHVDFINDGVALYWIDQFAQWRVDHNQFDVGIVKMCDIYDEFLEHLPAEDDSAKALRDFLIYAYNNWYASSMPDNHFAYCLFIGDWDYVPSKLIMQGFMGTPYKWLCAYEGYFRDLSSPSDSIDDIMLGRWPVKFEYPSAQVPDLMTIAQKTINYEKYPDVIGNWRRRGLLIAGDGGNFNHYVDSSTVYFSDISYDTFTIRYSQINNITIYRDSLTGFLNEGEIIAVYYDHGGPEAWWKYDTSYVKLLVNNSRLPVVISLACLTAMFQWDKPGSTDHPNYPPGVSLGEHFLFNSDGGCVAFYGAARFATSSTLKYGKFFLKQQLRYQHWILGKMLLNPYVIDTTTLFDQNYYCLLGDPALDLGDYTAYPDLPDLVVRPQGIDIKLLPPYPYPTSGDIIPIRAKVFNIGGETAYNVDVNFMVALGPNNIIYSSTVTFDEIKPRCLVDTTVSWNTALTHSNYYGEIGDCDFIVTADPNDVITESWEGNNTSSITKKVALYPNKPGWPKKIPYLVNQQEHIPAIANLDGQGSVEIVYAGLDSLYIFDANGDSYSENWPKYFRDVYGVALADINANGYIDIIAVSEDSIKVYFNNNGNIVLNWSAKVQDDYKFTGLPAIGHIQLGITNIPDIVMLAQTQGYDNYLKVLIYDYDGGSPIYEWNSSEGLCWPTYGSPSIENVLTSGTNEVVISYPCDISPYRKTEVFNAQYPYLHKILGYGRRHMTPALADMNNDNHPDILTGGESGILLAYDAYNDQEIWQTSSMSGGILNSPAVGNISRVYPSDVEVTYDVSQGNNGRIRLVDRLYGDDLQNWPLDLDGRVCTSPALAKLEGRSDEYCDIVFGSTYPKVYAVNYMKDPIYPFPLPVFGLPNSAIIGDIDGDRKSEIILASDDGYLHVWENIDSKVLPYSLEWPQFHHDYQRTGLYGWVGGLRGGDANPKTFSTGTTLSFSLKKALHTKIKIFDAEANLVKTLVNQTLPQGTYNPVWFGKDENYAFLPNGIYFIEIKVKNESKIIPVEINR